MTVCVCASADFFHHEQDFHVLSLSLLFVSSSRCLQEAIQAERVKRHVSLSSDCSLGVLFSPFLSFQTGSMARSRLLLTGLISTADSHDERTKREREITLFADADAMHRTRLGITYFQAVA